jgi:transcriptional regulator with GAF, ATPase, and Fis domain
LRLSELPPEFREPRAVNQQIRQSVPLSAEEETAAIRQALEQSNGMVTPAAEILGACPRISLSNEQPLFDSEKF